MQKGIILAAAVLALNSACGDGAQRSADTAYDTSAQSESHVADTADSAHAHEGAPEAAPLLAIMQKLGAEMTALTYGLMTDSAAQVAQSAHAIAQHASIADLQRIQNQLGPGFAEFERLDIEVHEMSVRLAQAAEAGNMDSVITQLAEVQRGCLACHARFRERLRTNRAPKGNVETSDS